MFQNIPGEGGGRCLWPKQKDGEAAALGLTRSRKMGAASYPQPRLQTSARNYQKLMVQPRPPPHGGPDMHIAKPSASALQEGTLQRGSKCHPLSPARTT